MSTRRWFGRCSEVEAADKPWLRKMCFRTFAGGRKGAPKRLKVGTLNVRSLLVSQRLVDGGVALEGWEKAMLVRRLMEQQDMYVLAVQETRWAEQKVLDLGGGFMLVNGGGTEGKGPGHGGVGFVLSALAWQHLKG